jgi:phosphotransferase family enzyme
VSFIPTPETVTSAWLTERLREAGHLTAEVRNFTRERVGTGQIGKCIRFELRVEGGDPTTPRSLIGKFPSDDPTSRQTGVQLRNFIKEVSFYRELRSRLTISVPRCYYAAIEGEGPEFALLLEDLAPARQGDQVSGCSAEVARAAVLELVGLHAPSWCDRTLRGIGWLGEPSEDSTTMVRALYGFQLPGFLERYGGRLEPDEAGMIERVADSKGAPFEPLSDPFALVHIDYRLDNLLIDDRTEPARISVVDWQSITLGSPLSDVAYFLGAGLLPEDRRRVEADIVRAYHHALERAGVGGYPFERCWNDYRRGAFAGLVVTVVASMMVQQTERGDEMFIAMARRHSRHAIDLGAEEFMARAFGP